MNNKAFTLIEVLVTALIITVLFAVMFSMLKSGSELYSGITASIEVRQHARNAMDRIVRETRETNSGTITQLSADSYHISFTSPRFKDGGGNLVPIQYYLSNGQIMREYPPGTAKPVAINATRLTFSKTGPQIDVLVQTEKTENGRTLVCVLKQKVRLRNE
jgi:prepilin-type N-terminal cleavage/methylation domain-containing protein